MQIHFKCRIAQPLSISIVAFPFLQIQQDSNQVLKYSMENLLYCSNRQWDFDGQIIIITRLHSRGMCRACVHTGPPARMLRQIFP